jgi:hypothetical protein
VGQIGSCFQTEIVSVEKFCNVIDEKRLFCEEHCVYIPSVNLMCIEF